MAAPRSYEQRKADTLALLSAAAADAWVATASPDGVAHMVPLSIGWIDECIVLVTESRSATAQNLVTSGRARVALGDTRDVVMMVVELKADHALADAPSRSVRAFASQSGWDPSGESNADAYRLLELRPVQVQAWREANEISERTMMRNGDWGDAAR